VGNEDQAGATLRVLGPADALAAARLVARGFAEEPGNVALLPDPQTRRVVLEMSARNMLHSALRRGTAHAAVVGEELAAIAVWHAPGARPVTPAVAGRAVVALVSNAGRLARAVPHVVSVLVGDTAGGIALLRERRRAVAEASRGLPWYLALLATAPEHRGQGLARALLERQLRRCDEDGAAAWLETTDPVNPPIYERFGFRTVAHIDRPAWLPGFWVMRREPARVIW
jgi:GNAT superfamily N-acetyltransferase